MRPYVYVAGASLARGAAAISVGSAGCSGDFDAQKPLVCGDPELFRAAVSPYLEARCGTLDCHGSMQRPMRLYGRNGLRHPDEQNITGGEPTTALELDANFASVCALEPEKMAGAIEDLGASGDRLIFIAKPRATVRHKGGKVVDEGDDADRCMLGWISKVGERDAAEVSARCEAAAAKLP